MSTLVETLPEKLTAETTKDAEWPLYAVLFASISIVTGLIWDISWHRTIGRDTFWSPPHVLEQIAALVAGLSCGWLVLHATLRGSRIERARTIRFWGMRGPLGAWVCIWGTLMMITSAPFDDWWHNAYGLDVKVMSPPHMVLAWGMIAIQLGAMLMALAWQNRASAERARRLGMFYAVSAGILLTMYATVLIEYAAFPNHMHGSSFYRITALGTPAILLATARPSRLRYPATTAAAIYLLIGLLSIWILQLFPAQPMLAPIYNPVTHMVPPPFPLLLVAPAFAIDLILRRARGSDWRLALLLGPAFVLTMLVVQWFFADFLLSPYARNFVFGADQWDYNIRLGDWRYRYWTEDASASEFVNGVGIAVVTAFLSARFGLWVGKGMARVQR